MSGTPYSSVLRSPLTRRLWIIISFAMLIPVGLGVLSRWFEAEDRRASQQNQELTALARDQASTLLFNSRGVPEDYARGLDGRYLVVLDGAGAARFSSSPVPEELVQLFARRSPHAVDAPGGTTILAWYASGREWRGAMSYVPPGHPGDLLSGNTVVVFAPEATFGNTFGEIAPMGLGLVILSIVIAFAVAAIITERYLPSLRKLQRALSRLRDRRFETISRLSAEEFSPLEREFNLTALALQRDWRAFEVLGDVDRALLAANEIDRGRDPHGSHRAFARPPVHGRARRGRAAGAAREFRRRDDRDDSRGARGTDHRARRGDAPRLPVVDARCGCRILLAVAGGGRGARELDPARRLSR
jgi:hypothetical protein